MTTQCQHRDTYRYELKYASDALTDHELTEMVLLHPALFREIYSQRSVNNIYFDTPDRHAYADAVRGDSQRLKIRIRWYGKLFSQVTNPVLELKRKDGQVGKKDQYPLQSFLFDKDFSTSTLDEIWQDATLPELTLFQLSMCEPALLNRYQRRYYMSADKRFRVTIDSGLEFRRIEPSGCLSLHRRAEAAHTVLEIKYNRQDDEDLSQVLHGFPIRLSKSSKYASGVASFLDL